MSEVELFAHVQPLSITRDKYGCIIYRPATTAEIMDNHPRCKDCDHYTEWKELSPAFTLDEEGNMEAEYDTISECAHGISHVGPLFYCPRWTPITKEHL